MASYIRSLDYPVVPEARPWNPPYQPGPDIETRDDAAYKWAAGAGIDAVLDTDQEMIVELFGSENPTEEEVMLALNHFETEPNMRTGRVSVQFPDWISWIPRTHPRDVFSTNDYAFLEQAYQTLRQTIIDAGGAEGLNRWNNKSVYANNDIFKALGEFATAAHNVLSPTSRTNAPSSPVWANATETSTEAQRISLSAWHSVKMFEVINEFGLHDIEYVGVDVQYPFQWPTRQWAVFQNAAHVIADKRGNSYFSIDATDRDRTRSMYLSSIWYQLQMVLTPGNRLPGIVVPNDYAYNLLHIQKIGHRSGFLEPARFLQNYWQCAYQRNNGVAPNGSGTVRGWNLRELSPWGLYGRATPDVAGEPVDLTFKELENYHTGLQGEIQSAFLRTTAEILNKFSLDEVGGDYNRITLEQSMATGRTDSALEFRDIPPEYGVDNGVHKSVFMHRSSTKDGAGDAVEVDAFYTLVRLLHQEKVVSQDAYYAIKDWTDAAWDTTTWTNWPTDPYSLPPTVVFADPTSANIITNAGINLSVLANASDDYGLQNVRLWRYYDSAWNVVSMVDSPPFIWSGETDTNDPDNLLKNLMPGDYLYRIIATDTEGQNASATISLQVDLSLSDAYNNWIAQYAMPDQDALPTANPDGDKLNNILEFALGGHPALVANDNELMPALQLSNTGTAEYLFRSLINRESDGVIYTIEYTDDKTSNSWSTLTTPWAVSNLTDNADYELATIPVDTESNESMFIRLKVTIQNRDDLP